MPRYFHAWRASGLWQRINGILLAGLRLAGLRLAGLRLAGLRKASPGAGVIDSQSVKTPEPRNHGKRGNLRL